MNEPTMDNLVRRMDRLERENRWLKSAGALVLVGITAVVVMGQAKPRFHVPLLPPLHASIQ